MPKSLKIGPTSHSMNSWRKTFGNPLLMAATWCMVTGIMGMPSLLAFRSNNRKIWMSPNFGLSDAACCIVPFAFLAKGRSCIVFVSTSLFLPARGVGNWMRSRITSSSIPLLRLDRIYIRGFTVKRAKMHFGAPWSKISDHAALSVHLTSLP